MKIASFALSVIALIGVAILFFRKPSDKKHSNPVITTKDSSGREVIVSGARIAYLDMDSLENNYTYYKNKNAEITKEEENLDTELEKEYSSLQNDMMAFQKKAESGGFTSRADGEAAQQGLVMRQNALESKRKTMGSKLGKKRDDFTQEIYNNIKKVVKKYAEDKDYDYVLYVQKEGAVVCNNDDLNITADVISLMNESSPEKK